MSRQYHVSTHKAVAMRYQAVLGTLRFTCTAGSADPVRVSVDVSSYVVVHHSPDVGKVKTSG